MCHIGGEFVPLSHAHGLLPVKTIKQAIEAACLETFDGLLPKDDYGRYAIAYDQDSLDRHLRDAVMTALQDGRLSTTGRDNRLPINAPPVQLPADLWASVTVNWPKSEAAGPGFVIVSILIAEAPAECPTSGGVAPATTKRKSGTKPVLRDAVAKAMVHDIRSQKFTLEELKDMKQLALSAEYGRINSKTGRVNPTTAQLALGDVPKLLAELPRVRNSKRTLNSNSSQHGEIDSI